jgi:hypothetical protein
MGQVLLCERVCAASKFHQKAPMRIDELPVCWTLDERQTRKRKRPLDSTAAQIVGGGWHGFCDFTAAVRKSQPSPR